MLAEGIAPNAITYNALIHASAGGGLKPGDASSPSPGSGGVVEAVAAGVTREEGGPSDTASDTQGTGARRACGERRWDRVMPLLDEMQKAG